ncbi:unnamed protein product, partial [Citrullus colocynthis]
VAPAPAFRCCRRLLVAARSSAAAADRRNRRSTSDLCQTLSLYTDLYQTSLLVFAVTAAAPSEAVVRLGGTAEASLSVSWADRNRAK